MKPTRIRNQAQARRYVAGNVATMLRADFDNASEWMHHHDGDGNLSGGRSEELVHQAARELAQQLENFSKGRQNT